MPNITQYTAKGEAAVSNLSNRAFPVDTGEGGRALAQGLENLGEGFALAGRTLAYVDAVSKEKQARLQEKLQAEQDSQDIDKLSVQALRHLDATKEGLGKATVDANGAVIQEATDPMKYVETFNDRARLIPEELQVNAYNSRVKKGFIKRFEEMYATREAVVRHEGNLLVVGYQKAAFAALASDLAEIAGSATDPLERDAAIKVHAQRIGEMLQRGYLTPEAAQQQKHVFAQKRLTAFLRSAADSVRTPGGEIDYQAGAALVYKFDKNGSFAKLDSETKARLLEGIQARVHTQQNILEHNINKVKQQHFQAAYTLAANGKLGPYVEDIANGLTAIDPSHAAALKHLNENPLFGAAATGPVLTLQSEYHLGTRTDLNRILDFRAQLNKLVKDGGGDAKAIDKFANELQGDEMSARSLRAAEKNANIQDATRRYKSEFPPHSNMDKFTPKLRNEFQMEQAEVEARVGRGEPIEKVLDDIRKRRAEKKKTPKGQQDDLRNKLRQGLPRSN